METYIIRTGLCLVSNPHIPELLLFTDADTRFQLFNRQNSNKNVE